MAEKAAAGQQDKEAPLVQLAFLLDTSNSIYSLERLGMSEKDRRKIEAMISRPHGMILSTGPTGSGKSTSLYSILKKINQPDIHIITVEDPVEYHL